MNWTVVSDRSTSSDITSYSGMLPLHFLLQYQSPIAEVSDEGDRLHLLLSLYPAAAGIEDDHSVSPYDIAVAKNLNVYFIRFVICVYDV
jgi:hypothetical protein